MVECGLGVVVGAAGFALAALIQADEDMVLVIAHQRIVGNGLVWARFGRFQSVSTE
jgi:hypothetical protein